MKKILAFIFLFAMTTASFGQDFDRKDLIQRAIDTQSKSYAPYSNYNVAAAVLCDSGKIYTGANIENASYPAGNCAEKTAINIAALAGERNLVAIAIVGGAKGTHTDYCAPCGICRQVMRVQQPQKNDRNYSEKS